MRVLVKHLLDASADLAARCVGFSFPAKFTWRWKFEMLFLRYEPGTTRLFRRLLRPGMTVIDIGAHIGYFSRLAAYLVGEQGRVDAFEPDRENRALLVLNTRGYGQVHVHPDAVTERDGTVPFYRVPQSSGCHSTLPTAHAREEKVPAVTLDGFLDRTGVHSVDLIKMDIEGGEWNALTGMERTLAQKDVRLIMEYNPAALARVAGVPEDILRRIEKHGFKIHAITARGIVALAAPYSDIARHLSAEGSVNILCERP